MTGIATDAAELQHPIGRSGRFALRLPAGEVSITAVDGNVAKVRDLGGRSLADRFDIAATDGSLELTVRNRLGITLAIGDFSIGGGSAELAVELPRGTRVAIDTASADVSVTGITGPGRYRTASGDLILQDVAGNLEVEGVSADIRIEATAPIELTGRTISGDVVIRAPRLTRFEYTTTSGDLRVDAELSGKGPYSIKSISGDVMLVGRAGLQIEAQTVTGDLMTDLQHRTESGNGRRVLIVGKPVATLAFKSVSGDLRVDEPRDAVRPMTPAGTPDASSSMPAFAGESRSGDAPTPSTPAAEAARLEILKALERGEIDVETATERLMTVEGV